MVRSFVSPTPTAGGSFGCSVAFLGDEILVGAHRDTVDVWQEGAAYLFDGSSGELIRTFQNPTPVAGENFGYSVAVMGGNVLIGATGNRTGSVGAGAAYLFDGSTGTLLRTFTNPDPVYMGSFGNECAAVGDGILIGAYRNDHEAGAAYLFDISTGALLHEFRSAPGTYGQGHVGTSLGALGNGALVGAPSDATYARGGDVLLFDTATGALLRVFENPRTGGMDNFGYSVSSVGDNLLVGAPYDDTNWYNSGAAYLLDGQTGALIHEFPNPTPADRDCFGQRVATLGNNVLISAIGDSQVGAVSGAVYLFEGIPEPAALLLLALGSLALARRRR